VAVTDAAADDDDNHGLVGVSDLARQLQQAVHVTSKIISSILHHATLRIKSSKWPSRDWAYQEPVSPIAVFSSP
jgi:hypothetical protein